METKYKSAKMRRVEYGVVSNATLDKYKYLSVKEGDEQFEAIYLVRNNKKELPKAIYEIKRWSKERRRFVVRVFNVDKISLRQLPWFIGVEFMFNDIKVLDEQERLVAYVTNDDLSNLADEVGENNVDGYQVGEPLTITTYRATFGGRDISYKKSNKSARIWDVKLYDIWLTEWKNQLIENYRKSNTVDGLYEIVESEELRVQDSEFFIDNQVYAPENLRW